MKKIIRPTMFLFAFFMLHPVVTYAESVAVAGDKIFIADGGLIVRNLLNGQISQCADPLLDPAGNPLDSNLLATATDVVIEADYAVVTVHPFTESGPVVDAVAVDVSSCLVPKAVISVGECISTVNLDDGILIIPCVEINGVVNTVHMQRRGKSSNWEVSFLGDNPALAHYHHHDDDDDDDDDD